VPVEGRRSSAGVRRAKAYQGAFEAVFGLLIPIGVGWWADERWGTAPLWLLVGLGVGFAAMILRLLRMRSILEAEQESDRSQDHGNG